MVVLDEQERGHPPAGIRGLSSSAWQSDIVRPAGPLRGHVATSRYRDSPDDDHHPWPPTTKMHSTYLVGREAELDLLEQMLTEARSGRGGSVFLVGEHGIGKSRLAAEIAGKALGANLAVMRGRGNAVGPTVPFRALTEALLSLARRRELPDDSHLAPYRPALGRLVPDWGADGGDGDVPLVVLAEAVLRLAAAAGRDRGTLLVLENLHHADLETLAVVEYLISNLDQQGTMLLGTVRAEATETVDLIRSAHRRRQAAMVELSRLSRPDVVAIVGACLDISPAEVPEDLADLLWRTSAGNPLMAEELLQGMVSNGRLARSRTGWHAAPNAITNVPPALVRDIARRTERLGEQSRAILFTAAVLGQRFRLSAVKRITVLDEDALLSELRALISAQLVIADERDPDWYTFQHPLMGEAILTLYSPADRARCARRAAAELADAQPDPPATTDMPGALRACGVTPREHEVLGLLVFRLGNKDIAARLHISPRTVEKHVASLLGKTGQADRARLIDYAAAVLPQWLAASHPPSAIPPPRHLPAPPGPGSGPR
jgi:DNA-binding CsgD family transcriptional regulator